MAAAWLVIWQLIHTVIGKEVLIPAPLAVLSRLAELAVQGEFWQHIGLSLLKILIGYLSALLFGGILGILTARSRLLDALLSPAAKIIRATPPKVFDHTVPVARFLFDVSGVRNASMQYVLLKGLDKKQDFSKSDEAKEAVLQAAAELVKNMDG